MLLHLRTPYSCGQHRQLRNAARNFRKRLLRMRCDSCAPIEAFSNLWRLLIYCFVIEENLIAVAVSHGQGIHLSVSLRFYCLLVGGRWWGLSEMLLWNSRWTESGITVDHHQKGVLFIGHVSEAARVVLKSWLTHRGFTSDNAVHRVSSSIKFLQTRSI